MEGRYLSLADAVLEGLPAQGRVGFVVGGGNPELLRVAAARADVVGLSGLGRTLPDGHRHEVRWSRADLDDQLSLIRHESVRAGTTPEVEALVQVVSVADDREQALADLREHLPDGSPDDLAETPFVLVGTVEEMAEQLLRQAQQLGISRYLVRESAVEHVERILAQLADR